MQVTDTVVFENDVKVNGTQTFDQLNQLNDAFENDVKVNGTQTVYH